MGFSVADFLKVFCIFWVYKLWFAKEEWKNTKQNEDNDDDVDLWLKIYFT